MALDKIDNTNYLIRLPLILRDKKLLQKIISEVNFEIGYWFKNLATDNRFSKFQFIKKKNLECKVAEDISKNIINIPLNISDHNKHYYDHFLKIINE